LFSFTAITFTSFLVIPVVAANKLSKPYAFDEPPESGILDIEDVTALSSSGMQISRMGDAQLTLNSSTAIAFLGLSKMKIWHGVRVVS
jgi:hypothetical protein